MNKVLKDLKPTKVLEYFEELSQIPRGSGNEKGISNYLVKFAKEHNLNCIQDSALNVIIKKKATPGYENSPAVVLQGHMDMVCEKNVDTEHDFTKDPIKLRVVDDMIYATGTTLGSDNGIAVAMGLAILDSSDIAHPALELLVTTGEETGMDGASALNADDVAGRTIINLDSEEEGTLLVSCAGGLTARTTISPVWESTDKTLSTYVIKIRGLKGGHSGMEIDKERANSNKLMGRVLMSILPESEFRLASLNGGSKHNAIPREMDAVILIKAEDKASVENKLKQCEEMFKTEFRSQDPDVRIEFEASTDSASEMLSKQTTENIISYLYLVPNGVNSMSMDIKGLVESSMNLGVVDTNKDKIEFITSVRSSIKSLKEELYNRIVVTAKLTGAKVTTESSYPEWSYKPDSKIRTIFEDVHEKMYGKKPIITAIHAGVECGLFAEKFGEMDAVSFGPNLYDVHTPNEHMSISSVQRSWEYLIEVLKNIK